MRYPEDLVVATTSLGKASSGDYGQFIVLTRNISLDNTTSWPAGGIALQQQTTFMAWPATSIVLDTQLRVPLFHTPTAVTVKNLVLQNAGLPNPSSTLATADLTDANRWQGLVSGLWMFNITSQGCVSWPCARNPAVTLVLCAALLLVHALLRCSPLAAMQCQAGSLPACSLLSITGAGWPACSTVSTAQHSVLISIPSGSCLALHCCREDNSQQQLTLENIAVVVPQREVDLYFASTVTSVATAGQNPLGSWIFSYRVSSHA